MRGYSGHPHASPSKSDECNEISVQEGISAGFMAARKHARGDVTINARLANADRLLSVPCLRHNPYPITAPDGPGSHAPPGSAAAAEARRRAKTSQKARKYCSWRPPYALRAAITTRTGPPDSLGSAAGAGVAGSRLSPWEESFFCRTGPTLSTGSDVQFVRVLPSKFAAGISVGDEEIQRRERRWIRFTIYWEPFRTMMPKV